RRWRWGWWSWCMRPRPAPRRAAPASRAAPDQGAELGSRGVALRDLDQRDAALGEDAHGQARGAGDRAGDFPDQERRVAQAADLADHLAGGGVDDGDAVRLLRHDGD